MVDGAGGATRKPDVAQASPGEFVYDDPLGVFRAAGFDARNGVPTRKPAAPSVGPVARRAYELLGLEESVDAVAVKARYKQLVKQVHPDANGGRPLAGRPAARDHQRLQHAEGRRPRLMQPQAGYAQNACNLLRGHATPCRHACSNCHWPSGPLMMA